MSSSGFCCRCGKETERKEQTGVIVTWVCSTSCATKACSAYSRPRMAECDKLRSARPFMRVMEEYLEWLDIEKGTSVDHATITEFFNIDGNLVEKEKEILEILIKNYQQDALRKAPE